mmetsp:Transcript_21444/g.36643  ORF Transcript_21444/g.36643 Transcript_21444/m.36643 type:complete len:266 (-) Transcript_21444:1210-2007(-)
MGKRCGEEQTMCVSLPALPLRSASGSWEGGRAYSSRMGSDRCSRSISAAIVWCRVARVGVAAEARADVKDRLARLCVAIGIEVALRELDDHARRHCDGRGADDRSEQKDNVARPTRLLEDSVDQTLTKLAGDKADTHADAHQLPAESFVGDVQHHTRAGRPQNHECARRRPYLRLHPDREEQRADDHSATNTQQACRHPSHESGQRELLQRLLRPLNVSLEVLIPYSHLLRVLLAEVDCCACHERAQHWHGGDVPEPPRPVLAVV